MRNQEMTERYLDLLAEYLRAPSESALTGAYTWGRAAVAGGIGLLDITQIQQTARRRLRETGASPGLQDAAESFFAESLAPFEIVHRGFREANQELRKINLELEEAVRSRDEFLTIASHELKTPITPIKLYLQMMRQASSLFDRENLFLKRLESCERSLNRLCRLVDELLSVSRIRAGRMSVQREPVELTRMVREVLDQHQLELERAGCTVELHADEPVTGDWDPLKIEEVITGLVSNAIKFDGGHPIEVRVSRDGRLAKVVVKDQGRGIDPADQERIFQRFERAVSARNFGGLGLGLYVARQIVEAHGGKISVTSRLGAGSTFTVLLPLQAPGLRPIAA